MKGGRFPWWGGGRRRASPEIKQVPATNIGGQAGSGPERDTLGRIKSREDSSASAPPGRDAPGERPAAPTGSAVRRLSRAVDWIVRVLAIAIVAVLLWFANFAQSIQLADVTSQLNPSPYIGSFVVTGAWHVDHDSVPLQVTGMLTESGAFVAVLELDTRPSGESRWQKQPACCQILGNSFTGSASLPAASAPDFGFQLVSIGDNTVLATGSLAVHVESFPGGSQLAINIIGGLGLIAVVLEILRLVVRRRSTPEPASSTRQGESNAKKQ